MDEDELETTSRTLLQGKMHADEVDSVHTTHTSIGTDALSITGGNMNKADSRDSNQRYCWVCFATDEDDETAAWVQPCNCRGTTKWVCCVDIHQSTS